MFHKIFIGEGLDVGAVEVIEEIQSLSQPLYIRIIGLFVVVNNKPIPDDYQIDPHK